MSGAQQEIEMCWRFDSSDKPCSRAWLGKRKPVPVRCEDCRMGQATKRDITIAPSDTGAGGAAAVLREQKAEVYAYRERTVGIRRRS